MTNMALAGVQSVTAKGRVYHYHRKSGRRLSDNPTAGEVLSIEALLVPKVSAVIARPGTLGELMASYRAADVFLDLKPATRASYEKIMKVLAPLNALPLKQVTPVTAAAIRDQVASKRGGRTANFTLAMLSVICKHGIERGVVAINPTVGIRRVKRKRDAPKANRPWLATERKAFMEHAPRHVALAIGVMMFTGLRRTDACQVPKRALQDGFLVLDTSKTGQSVKLPVHGLLAGLLAAMPHDAPTLLANSDGKPWTPDGLSSSFQKARDELLEKGLVGEGLTMHGLRHTVGTMLRSCTDDIDLIRRWLGQKTLHMALHYSETADTSDEFVVAMNGFNPLA